MSSDTLTAQANEPSEDEVGVLRWRHEQFVELGYGRHAWVLARSNVDLGRARSLRKAGCPLELALRILL